MDMVMNCRALADEMTRRASWAKDYHELREMMAEAGYTVGIDICQDVFLRVNSSDE